LDATVTRLVKTSFKDSDIGLILVKRFKNLKVVFGNWQMDGWIGWCV
jgi:hypothetical protein